MKTAIFISRHAPTQEQIELLADQDTNIIHVGDLDAFSDDLEDRVKALAQEHETTTVIAVHPLTCIAGLSVNCRVGVFENVNRAPEGERPVFVCGGIHWRYMDGYSQFNDRNPEIVKCG